MKAAYLTTDSQRMWDLVRQQRSELLEANLITFDEYGALAAHEAEHDGPGHGSKSPRRLESYDELRAKLDARTKALEAVVDDYEEMGLGHPVSDEHPICVARKALGR